MATRRTTKKPVKKMPAKKKPVAKKAAGEGSCAPLISPGVEKVDEIPPTGRANSRTLRYATKLEEIHYELGVGQSAILARFSGVNGAATVKREIERGHRAIYGELDEWEFTARRFSDYSILYVTKA